LHGALVEIGEQGCSSGPIEVVELTVSSGPPKGDHRSGS